MPRWRYGATGALVHTPIDAIPDLSENQVIVFTEWQGRSPQEVEDQITYPLTVNLQGCRCAHGTFIFGLRLFDGECYLR